jgi:osmotically inducible protein OsmC
MKIRTAQAEWKGTFQQGQGTVKLGSGAFEGQISYAARFEEGAGTNPEELIAAAHAGCFSMTFSNDLGKAGFTPARIQTKANVHFDKVEGRSTITKIHLDMEAEVPGLDEATFREKAEGAKKNCPVSRALAGVEITLNARLVSRTGA